MTNFVLLYERTMPNLLDEFIAIASNRYSAAGEFGVKPTSFYGMKNRLNNCFAISALQLIRYSCPEIWERLSPLLGENENIDLQTIRTLFDYSATDQEDASDCLLKLVQLVSPATQIGVCQLPERRTKWGYEIVVQALDESIPVINRNEQYLLLQISSVSFRGNTTKKVSKPLKPSEVVDTVVRPPHFLAPVGMICHLGTAEGGHYITYVYSPEIRMWNEFDDETVSPCILPSQMRGDCTLIAYEILTPTPVPSKYFYN